jgi:hypothetical protein
MIPGGTVKKLGVRWKRQCCRKFYLEARALWCEMFEGSIHVKGRRKKQENCAVKP